MLLWRNEKHRRYCSWGKVMVSRAVGVAVKKEPPFWAGGGKQLIDWLPHRRKVGDNEIVSWNVNFVKKKID